MTTRTTRTTRVGAVTRWVAAAGAVAITLLAPAVPTAGAAAALPTATFAKTSDWGTGFEGSYTITNKLSVTLTSWQVSFTLPAGAKVTSLWNGTQTSSGSTYTVSNLSWNGSLAPGATASFGFDASYSGSYADPAGCTLNADPCDGSADVAPPTTPSGLSVLSTTSTSVSLSWTGSTDNLVVSGYTVLANGTKVATTSGTVATVTGLTPGASYAFSVQAFDEAGNVSGSSGAVSATTGSGTGGNHPPGVAAPFVDAGAWPTPNLTQIAQNTGLRQFSMGFIVNGTQTCQATWFNAYPMSNGFEQDDIASLRAMGGDVKPSFGGEAGTELAQSCTDVSSLTAQYQSVVDTYHLTQIDFDIEGSAVADPVSVDRRSQAMAALQKAAAAKGQSLAITLTLPVLPSGLTSDGLNVVKSALKYGVTITTVNVMAMDFGDVEAPNPSGQMGTYAIDSAKSLHDQLVPLYPGRPDGQIWNEIGVTPMIGQNDNASEVFTQTDMRQLLSYAQQAHLGELAFWDVTRDGNACTGSLSKCTNISQTPYEFSKIIAPYQG